MKKLDMWGIVLVTILVMFVFYMVGSNTSYGIILHSGVLFWKTALAEVETEKDIKLKHLSNILPEACRLCGDREGSLISLYDSKDNLGIISLNTFKLVYIEINHYDVCGNLITVSDSSIGTYIQSTGENGFFCVVTVNANRGYAFGNIKLNQDKIMNLEKVSGNLCMECLNQVMETTWKESYGLGIINFKTGEIRVFDQNIRGFMLGDFYVLCEPRTEGDGGEISDIDIHVFYCPERYIV